MSNKVSNLYWCEMQQWKCCEAQWKCPKGLRVCAQKQQCVQIFSKLMSSQPQFHIGTEEVVIAVVWVSSGKCLKSRQQRDLKEDLVRRDHRGLARALLHLLSHTGALWRVVSDAAKIVNSLLSVSHGLLPTVVCWCWVCARLPGPGCLLKAEHHIPCSHAQSLVPLLRGF